MIVSLATDEDAIVGCLIGTAVGDAIGLPAEGLPKRRLGRMYTAPFGHRFAFGRGMTSDDTEHTCMVAQSLIASGGEPGPFARSLAHQLRLWLLMVPAGAGLATLKACLRLLVGFPPQRSGVFSAGNGPAMRSALIGVCFGHDESKMRSLVRASTRITHTDPKAEHGALAVALAAYLSAHDATPDVYLSSLTALLGDDGHELLVLVEKAAASASAGQSTESFAMEIGQGTGVSGYIYATVPVVLHAWFRSPRDYRAAVSAVIACGGDTDTTAAIAGAIVGAGVGLAGIPNEWTRGLMERPRSVAWMERLGERLAQVVNDGIARRPLPVCLPCVLARNVFFLIIVLLHGFRRLLPPY